MRHVFSEFLRKENGKQRVLRERNGVKKSYNNVANAYDNSDNNAKLDVQCQFDKNTILWFPQ